MKHLENIINNLITLHQNPDTTYSPQHMFSSANDLSFAISRLMDAQKTLSDEYFEIPTMTSTLLEQWISIRESMPADTAKELAICIINNTPLSKTDEQIKEIEQIFFKTMYDFTGDDVLSKVLTELFFGEKEAKMPRMKDF